MLFEKLNRRTKIILLLQSAGMLIGTTTHFIWIINNGFLSVKYNAPLPTKLFWDSLIFLDFITIIFLLFKPKVGLWMTLFIIIVDILHNTIFALYRNNLIEFDSISLIMQNWMLGCQVAFGLFVLLTFQNNLTEVNAKLAEAKT